METVVRQPGEAQPASGPHRRGQGRERRGRRAVLRARGDARAGGGLTSRLHRHHSHVESWFVVDGALEFCSGNETLPAPAGSFVLAPPLLPHTFANPGPEEAPNRSPSTHRAGWIVSSPSSAQLRSTDDPGFKAFATLFDALRHGAGGPEDVPADVPVRVIAPGEGEHLSVGGGTITILADSAATGGSFAAGRLHGAAGLSRPAAPSPPRDRRHLLRARGRADARDRRRDDRGAARDVGGGRARDGAHGSRTPRTGPRAFSASSLPAASSSTSATLAAAIGDGPFDPAVVAPLIAEYDYEPA